MKQTKPPSCSSNIVLIGKNSRGNWVAQEQNGLFGGLFVNRAAAVKFALFENGHHPEAVVDTPNVLELSLNSSPLHFRSRSDEFRRHTSAPSCVNPPVAH